MINADTTLTLPVKVSENQFDSTGNIIKIGIVAALLTTGAQALPATANTTSTSCSKVDVRGLHYELLMRRKNHETDFSITNDQEDYTSSATLGIENFYTSAEFYQISQKLSEFIALDVDWDGFGGTAPTLEIINRAKALLYSLPNKFLNSLDIEEDIFPNSHGTITIEWRPDSQNVVSVEIGQTTANFYGIINGEIFKSEMKHEADKDFTEKIYYVLSKITPFYQSSPA